MSLRLKPERCRRAGFPSGEGWIQWREGWWPLRLEWRARNEALFGECSIVVPRGNWIVFGRNELKLTEVRFEESRAFPKIARSRARLHFAEGKMRAAQMYSSAAVFALALTTMTIASRADILYVANNQGNLATGGPRYRKVRLQRRGDGIRQSTSAFQLIALALTAAGNLFAGLDGTGYLRR